MPLVLSLRRGHDFYVGDTRFVVVSISDGFRFVLVRQGPEPARFTITDERATEIMEDVLVSAGDDSQSHTVRVVIDAPRHIQVLRGDRYRERRSSGGESGAGRHHQEGRGQEAHGLLGERRGGQGCQGHRAVR